MKWILLFFVCGSVFPLNGDQISRYKYLQLIREYPQFTESAGDSSRGEIQILLDSDKMAELEKSSGIDIGVIAESPWGWLWLNEACLFPDGHEAVFGRILLKHSLERDPGVAVMAMTPEDKVILLCNFRHPTRSWEIELPRGFVDKGESVFQAARREAREEAGVEVESEVLIGEIPPDTGITGTLVPVVMARVTSQKENTPEKEEVIEKVLTLSIPEIKEAFLKGYYVCRVQGREERIPFRDPFLSYGLLMYELMNFQKKTNQQ